MKKILLFLILTVLFCSNLKAEEESRPMDNQNLKTAIFAGGCFWCMQPPFDQTEGVIKTSVGYAGGHDANPTYEEVSSGTSGHAEVIEVTYDPSKVSYEKLLDVFWKNIDPTTVDQQFADRGSQYRTAIFYVDGEQKKMAIASKEKIEKSGWYDRPIVTSIESAGKFYPAEDYHQKYYKKNAVHYEMYKEGSGRAGYIKMMQKKRGEAAGK